MIGSEEIRTMIAALGCGIGAEDFDIGRLRYHRVIIMTDADVDGSHIRTLLLTFFYRQLPELINGGHVFIAQPPLYRAKRGKSETYIKDDRELDAFLVKRGVEGRSARFGAGGAAVAGAELEKLLQRLIAFRSQMQAATRRGVTRRVLAALLDQDARDRSFFASLESMNALARAIETDARPVTVILDEEHSLYRLEVEERNGHARSMTVAAETVLSSEFRALSATYRDLRGLAWPATVSADAAAESDDAEEAAEGEGNAAEAARRARRKGRPADVTIAARTNWSITSSRRARRAWPSTATRARRDEPRSALGDDDGPGGADAAAGEGRGSHRGRPDVHHADGRPGRAAQEVHRGQRAGCEEPGHLTEEEARRRSPGAACLLLDSDNRSEPF